VKERHQPSVVMVPAILNDDGSIIFMNSNGRRLARCPKSKRVETLDDARLLLEQLAWSEWLSSTATKDRAKSRWLTGWEAKFACWVTCARLRRRDRAFKSTRLSFEGFKTTDWKSATERMHGQARNAFYKHKRNRDGWAQWIDTVTKNVSNRQKGRYQLSYNNSASERAA
jgi:hypothetical protein